MEQNARAGSASTSTLNTSVGGSGSAGNMYMYNHPITQSDEQAPSATEHRKDSLRDTKTFYGLPFTSPHPNIPRDPSSSRLSNLRGRSRPRPNTSTSFPDRPTSSGSSYLPKSSSRSTVPIPTPRGFLAPKKPAAALRLEQKERAAAQARERQSERDKDTATAFPSELTHESPEEDEGPTEPFGIVSVLAAGPVEEHTPDRSWDRSHRHGVTDTSTLPQSHFTDISPDDLVNGGPKLNGGREENPIGHATVSHPSTPNRSTRTRVRKYTKFENPQTTWLCAGCLVTGGDSLFSVTFALTVLLGLAGVWLGTTGAWLWVHGREYGLAKGGGVAIVIIFVYLFGVAFSSLLASAFRDPGIIPRNLDPDPPLSQIGSWWDPLPREVAVKDEIVPVKYCETCKTYRPPRCSHCRMCGNCVDGIDHHCSYIHTCVGKSNYLSFIVLLISSTTASIYIVVFSAIHFSMLCHHDHISFGTALQASSGAAVSFLLGVLVLPAMCFLLCYHIRLLLWNLTTVEQIRASASSNLFLAFKRPDNPFANDSLLSNLVLASLGRPQFPSWIDASGWDEEDMREANPALTDPKWAREGL